jgi:hypothetical protein
MSLLFCVARFLGGVHQCAFLFLMGSSYNLNYECVISACIKSLHVWVKVHVSFLYLILVLWLHVGLQMSDVLFFV